MNLVQQNDLTRLRQIPLTRRMGASIRRSLRQILREKKVTIFRALISFCLPKLLAELFSGVKIERATAKKVADRITVLTFSAINMSMMSLMKTLNLFGKENTIIKRERARKQYRTFHQDNYFMFPFLPYKKRADLSYEDESGISFDKLKIDIEAYGNKIIQEEKEIEALSCGGVYSANDVIIIVEGHLLGAAHDMLLNCTFDETHGKYHSSHPSNGANTILCILIQCSKETCKRRRLGRRKRPKEEYDELERYIDTGTYVGIGFDLYGLPAVSYE